MENLKIRVENEAESKDAQELFFELGYKWNHLEGYLDLIKYPNIIRGHNTGEITQSIESDILYKECKEITLPELRDLVVLKRNNREDANVSEENCLYDLYLTESKELYFYHCGKNKWILSNLNGDDDYYESLKPIEKQMKEYLIKSGDGKYLLTHHDSIGAIEIPEGCNIITCEERKCGLVYFHWKSLDSDEFFLKDEKIWSNNFNETLSDFIEKNEGDVVIIWSRYTHPEELPFIDDEPSQSLNDQYAEIETVRQSAWKKQEGGSHYKNLKIQPMQYALENKLDYAQANVVKYVTRHKEKNGKEDLLKAIHNIELMIEFYYGEPK